MEKRLINCGCGMKFSQEWINIDFNSPFECVIDHNLLKDLPFMDCYADFIYNSHFLEHLTEEQAVCFLKECYRVLKAGGFLRIAVPDLEEITKEYLNKLEKVKKDPYNIEAVKEYEYIKIELLDQMVRRKPGGKMAEYWKKNGITDYVKDRSGNITEKPYQTTRLKRRKPPKRIFPRIISKLFSRFKIFQLYKAGEFELSGEKHLWMYDEYSLCEILRKCGFREIEVMPWNVSRLPDFKKYRLEINAKGKEYKPHCLYVEAVK